MSLFDDALIEQTADDIQSAIGQKQKGLCTTYVRECAAFDQGYSLWRTLLTHDPIEPGIVPRYDCGVNAIVALGPRLVPHCVEFPDPLAVHQVLVPICDLGANPTIKWSQYHGFKDNKVVATRFLTRAQESLNRQTDGALVGLLARALGDNSSKLYPCVNVGEAIIGMTSLDHHADEVCIMHPQAYKAARDVDPAACRSILLDDGSQEARINKCRFLISTMVPKRSAILVPPAAELGYAPQTGSAYYSIQVDWKKLRIGMLGFAFRGVVLTHPEEVMAVYDKNVCAGSFEKFIRTADTPKESDENSEDLDNWEGI